MKLLIYAVRDRATDQYANPMFLISNGQAIRAFADAVNNKNGEKTPLAEHPEDYDLYKLGQWDSDKGTFETDQPSQIAIGKDMLIRAKE